MFLILMSLYNGCLSYSGSNSTTTANPMHFCQVQDKLQFYLLLDLSKNTLLFLTETSLILRFCVPALITHHTYLGLDICFEMEIYFQGCDSLSRKSTVVIE